MVVELAAGQGTRMRSGIPKVLHEVGGRPMLEHVLDAARALQPRAVRVVVGHGGNQVRETLDTAEIELVDQPEQRGTGDAVRCAGPDFSGADWVLVLNGDVPLLRAETLSQWAQALAASDHDLG
ncbi:MAG TPA: NTP transferase domain-containing protein, partial [Gammaproteobacteria bacterium]|nr:NTP transferase domain-containing protein [Gammaproteobacteria bacterium]